MKMFTLSAACNVLSDLLLRHFDFYHPKRNSVDSVFSNDRSVAITTLECL